MNTLDIINNPTTIRHKDAPAHVQDEVFDILSKRIREADRSQLHALDKKIERHYKNGTLRANQLAQLDADITQELAILDLI